MCMYTYVVARGWYFLLFSILFFEAGSHLELTDPARQDDHHAPGIYLSLGLQAYDTTPIFFFMSVLGI